MHQAAKRRTDALGSNAARGGAILVGVRPPEQSSMGNVMRGCTLARQEYSLQSFGQGFLCVSCVFQRQSMNLVGLD